MRRFHDRSRPTSYIESMESMLYQIREVMEDEREDQRFLNFDSEKQHITVSKNDIYLGDSKIGPVALQSDSLLDMRMLVVGGSGSGKSYLTRNLVEKLIEHGSIVIICDDQGEWVTLRDRYDIILLGKDKKEKDAFGYCDIEVNEENFEAVLVECIRSKCSIVLRLNQWSELEDRQKLIISMNDFFINRAVHSVEYDNITVVFEEAHRFAEQGSRNPVNRACKNSMRELAAQGRRRCVSMVFITQRPPKLHADITSQCNIKMIGKLRQSADLDTSGKLLNLKPSKYIEINSDLDKEFIADGEYFCHDKQLDKDDKKEQEVVVFRGDSVKSPHITLKELIRTKYKVKPPNNKLQVILNNIERVLGEKTPKTSPDLRESDFNNDLPDPMREQPTWQGPVGLDPSKVVWNEPIEDRFANIVKVFSSISIENLCVLAVMEYDDTKVKNWVKENTHWLKISSEDVYTDKDYENIILESSQEILNRWKQKIGDDSYGRLLQYLYEDADENNSLGDVAEFMKLRTKEVKELVEKYSKFNLVILQHNNLYLNTILFDRKVDKMKRETLIEFEDDDDGEDFDDENEFFG